MQSFYVEGSYDRIWLSFDNSKLKYKSIEKVESYKKENHKNLFKIDSIGHLDGFYIHNSRILTTKNYSNPSIVEIDKGEVTNKALYPFKIYGNQVISFDRKSPSNFVLWASDDNKEKSIFLGEFDFKEFNIKRMIKTKIIYPRDAILQGLAITEDYIYALTGKKNSFPIIYKWNTQGNLLEKITLKYKNPWVEYGYYEPEGINVTSNTIIIGISKRILMEEKIRFSNCLYEIRLKRS